jgi:hypothetical protein
MVNAIRRGLSIADFEDMTIGMIIDYIYCYDEISNPKENKKPRKATQEDIDRFYGG